jgi:hypothetical protein
MRNLKKGRDRGGMYLVKWFFQFVSKAKPNTWSFENTVFKSVFERTKYL